MILEPEMIRKVMITAWVFFGVLGFRSAHSAPTCIASDSAIQDLNRSKEELIKKSKELSEKEGELKSRQLFISEEMKKLQALRTLINQDQGKLS